VETLGEVELTFRIDIGRRKNECVATDRIFQLKVTGYLWGKRGKKELEKGRGGGGVVQMGRKQIQKMQDQKTQKREGH